MVCGCCPSDHSHHLGAVQGVSVSYLQVVLGGPGQGGWLLLYGTDFFQVVSSLPPAHLEAWDSTTN